VAPPSAPQLENIASKEEEDVESNQLKIQKQIANRIRIHHNNKNAISVFPA
jgi:hypothetical protein